MIDDVGDLVMVVSVPLLVVIGLLAAFGYGTAAAVVSIIGFVGVVPLVLQFSDRLLEDEEGGEAAESDDPLDALRLRYVRGELSEAGFEREVERLLETEDVAVEEGAADREPELEQ